MIFTEDRQDVGQKDTFGDLVRLLAFLVVCFLPFLQERAVPIHHGAGGAGQPGGDD